MKKLTGKSFETLAVHAGERSPAADSTPVVTPIWPAVGYLYESMDEMDAVFEGTRRGPLYLRYGSPTVSAFETAVAMLEGAEAAQAYSSGMAAIHSALLAAGAKAGVSVVAALDVYGATFALLNRLLTTLGVSVRMVNVNNLDEVEAAVKETHAAILLAETISNPLLKVANVPALAELAHRNGAVLLVDNTFASPFLFNPIRQGADYVIHSATKYMAGHGQAMGGISVDVRKIQKDMVKDMAPNPIIFALANPTPEIMPEEVLAVRPDAIIGTGRVGSSIAYHQRQRVPGRGWSLSG